MRRAFTSTGLLLALGALAPGAHAQQPSVTMQITQATIGFGTANAATYASSLTKADPTPETITLTAGFGLSSVTATVCVKSTGLTSASSPAKPPADMQFSLNGSTGWTSIAATGTMVLTRTLTPFGNSGAQTVYWRMVLHAGDVPDMATNRANWTGTATYTLVLGAAPCP